MDGVFLSGQKQKECDKENICPSNFVFQSKGCLRCGSHLLFGLHFSLYVKEHWGYIKAKCANHT